MRRSGSNPVIAFDTSILSAQVPDQGVCVYATQLLRHFRELGAQYSVEVRPYISTGSDHGTNALAAAPGFEPKPTGWLRHSRLWRFGGACALAAMEQVDLVFNPHCTTLYLGRLAPAVTTIHDVIPVLMPWDSRVVKTLRFLSWAAARSSRAIITVSECSKKDVMNVYGLPASRVFVVYNGCDHEVFTNAPDAGLWLQTRQRLGLTRPYVLHYGAIKPNKNLPRLILAYRSLLARNAHLDLDLVLAGKPDCGSKKVLGMVEQDGILRGRVLLTGVLDQRDLAMVVKGASLAVFPSLYEGFCLPMIESMACGTPTIAANSSCLPEISGGVLQYFDPCSVQEMSACMEAALGNQDLRSRLAEKGRKRALQFQWQRCAEQTLEILAEAAGSSRN